MPATIRAAMASARVTSHSGRCRGLRSAMAAQPNQDRNRAEHIVGKMFGIGSHRAAGMACRGLAQSACSKKVDEHGDDQDGERPDAHCGRPGMEKNGVKGVV